MNSNKTHGIVVFTSSLRYTPPPIINKLRANSSKVIDEALAKMF
ncbi:MAG: hypothetical protein RIA69_06395 [Cyclobacteriaceae bacterium]